MQWFGRVFVGTSFAIIAAQPARADLVEVFFGACEPSGVLALQDGAIDAGFIVANDEDNVLRVYRPGETKPADVAGADLNGALGLDAGDEDQKVDFEAAARIGDRNYLIGSHSRSKKGNRRPSRETFLSITLTSSGENLGVSASASASLIEALAQVPALAESIALDDRKHEDLAAEMNGLNIEGMAQGPDRKSALLGMRNPLTRRGEAIVVPLQNPHDVVDNKATPQLGPPLLLDLGRRGIRSMEFVPATNNYVIVAGPQRNSGTFELYAWSGTQADKPQPIVEVNALLSSLTDFHPEAMLVDASGKKVRLFSDDGDLLDTQGIACQNLPDPADQKFRSVVITLP